MSTFISNKTFGQDIIYICSNPKCGHREKQLSTPDRNTTPCCKCNSIAVKSTVMEMYNFLDNIPGRY